MEHPTEDRLFVAAKAFIVREGRVLVLREAKTDPNNTHVGEYDVPGGRLEPGEDIVSALRREVREETGITVTVGEPFHVGEWWPQVRGEQWHIVGVFFMCSVAESATVNVSAEHDDAKWIDPESDHGVRLIPRLEEAFVAYRKRVRGD